MDSQTQQFAIAILCLMGGFVLGWYFTRREPTSTAESSPSSDRSDTAAALNALMEEIQESSTGQQQLWNDLRQLFARKTAPTAEELRAHQQANRCYAQLMKSYQQQIHRYDPDRVVVPRKLADEVSETERETADLANSLRRMETKPAPNDVPRLMKRLVDLESTNVSLRGELNVAKQQIAQQSEQLESAQDAALRDHLTGLPNRRALERQLAATFSNLHSLGRGFCLLMLDLDHFKMLNDNYGHPAGDAVLRLAARLMEDCCRGSDFVARYGGEEFVIIAVKANANGARLLAERVRERMENASLRFEGNTLDFTCSIGIAEADAEVSTEDLIATADQALYLAKEAGRNTIRIAVGGSAGPVDSAESTPQDVTSDG